MASKASDEHEALADARADSSWEPFSEDGLATGASRAGGLPARTPGETLRDIAPGPATEISRPIDPELLAAFDSGAPAVITTAAGPGTTVTLRERSAPVELRPTISS